MRFDLHPDLLRDTHPVTSWPLCDIRIMDDATYPWFVLVPRRADIRDTIDLDPADHARLWRESAAFSRAAMEAFAGEKLNVAALGNMTPQLHVHHVVRYATDPAWPGPIWGKVPMAPYSEAALEAAISRLAPHLEEARAALDT